MDGLQANVKGKSEKRRPVFRGSELQNSESAFLDYEMTFRREDQLGGNNGDSIAGVRSFTIFIG
ncbi:MAG: hypothetical protein SFX72_10895 [Isosphaeraceae bacterium]|nr:hypothetical protein [Isosphaeraceae bacterium]